jgi:hypothetical protein
MPNGQIHPQDELYNKVRDLLLSVDQNMIQPNHLQSWLGTMTATLDHIERGDLTPLNNENIHNRRKILSSSGNEGINNLIKRVINRRMGFDMACRLIDIFICNVRISKLII